MNEPKLSVMADGLEKAYAFLRELHPDIRPAIFAIYLHPRNDRRGHYWKSSWNTRGENGTVAELDEMHISSHLFHGSEELPAPQNVLRTMLHEAAHSIAITREIQDTSRNGRYHGNKFKKLAEEMGLVVEKDKTIGTNGYVTTDITLEGMQKYAQALEYIKGAVVAYQDLQRVKLIKGKGKKRQGMLKMVCGCGRIIRASRAVAYGPVITCGDCGFDFEAV